MSRITALLLSIVFLVICAVGTLWVTKHIRENQLLKQVIDRLSAESRIAEVLVSKSVFNEESRKIETTIKFLEFGSDKEPLPPRYFTFQGNIIQFQCLVIRFQDKLVRSGDKLRGKSAYLFLKVFALDGARTEEFDLIKKDDIPQGYKVPGVNDQFEKKLWEEFWNYALDPRAREREGVKNAQIEAPGSLFLPGTIYTIRIEHDGGIRIDTQPIPEILKGEKLGEEV